MNCPLCFSEKKSNIPNNYYLCSECSAIYKDKNFYLTLDDEQARYEEHNNDVEDLGYQKFVSPIVDHILERFTSEDVGLDFGSGTGPVTSKLLLDQGYNILQYDPFFANNPELLEQSYNYIASCEVIEHFHHPHAEFQKLFSMLKSGGELVCMTHLYDGKVKFEEWYYPKDPTHVFIYQERTIEYIVKKFGFSSFFIDNRLIVLKK
ncbi:MAG: class I SAM-dependent methyltransferase [Spirochaetales bacterium]|nr:class I SAM-dependent methyltransferase [Spirochaetales bacterium]